MKKQKHNYATINDLKRQNKKLKRKILILIVPALIGYLTCLNWGIDYISRVDWFAPKTITILNRPEGEAVDAVSENSDAVSDAPADYLETLKVVSRTDEKSTPPSKPSNNRVEEEIRKVFGKDADTAIAIAKAESGLNPTREGDGHLTYWKNGKMYGDSIGVFQIRTFNTRPDREKLKDYKFNIAYAYELYKSGGWEHWTVYKNGSYLKFLTS